MEKTQTTDSHNRRVIEPIRSEDDIRRIRSVLHDKPRDLLLFDLATQTGLEMKQLLALRVGDLLGCKVGDSLPIGTGDTGLGDAILVNVIIHETFQRFLKEINPKPEDYLFKSRKGQKPLNLTSVSNMIKGWFKAADIKGLHGARTLRKTWEYAMRAHAGDKEQLPGKIDSTKTLKPIETVTFQEKVYDRLFDAIVSGSIPPGERLTINNLSKRFGVSSMPVKMALNKLEARGFVTSLGKKGSMVRELSVASLNEINRIRLVLEIFAAKESCRIRTEETLTMLESMLQILADTDDLDTLYRTHKQFHCTCYRDANMPILQNLIGDLLDMVTPYLIHFVSEMGKTGVYREPGQTNHQGILEGMRRRDPKEVVKWLKVDLTYGNEQSKMLLERRNTLNQT